MSQTASESGLVLYHAAASFHTWKQADRIEERGQENKASVLNACVALWNSWTERRVVGTPVVLGITQASKEILLIL
jgi:hypothetical protein